MAKSRLVSAAIMLLCVVCAKGQGLVKVDANFCINVGVTKGRCTLNGHCCNKDAVCDGADNYCCLPHGKACSRHVECCSNPGVLGVDKGRAGDCQSGKRCAPFGTACARDDDCCDKNRKCRGDGHTKGTYCA